MALEPGPMRVIHNFFSTKTEVLADIDKLDFWPTTYVFERMEELPLHCTMSTTAVTCCQAAAMYLVKTANVCL
jgi:hypothetical protein